MLTEPMSSAPLPCLADLQEPPPSSSGWLPMERAPLPGLDDEEGERLPTSLPPVVDAHVHVFPDRVFEAIWRWFDTHGWPIRYRLPASHVAQFLLSRGVHQIVALHYAHRPGMARSLNQFMAAVCADEPRIIGLATVLPGEADASRILDEAFSMGLQGVKMHCHVQCFAPDDPAMHEVYEACVRADRPLVMHAGREPKSTAYRCDTHALCSADRVARVLEAHPRLRLCVPHLGADEFDAYERLLERHDGLWLDTTMVAAGYFPVELPLRLLRCRPDRVLYGTDFPNLPYAWDREIKRLVTLGLPEEELAALLGQNALRLFAGTPPRGTSTA
ncbi:amidohydrolase family protein [Chondromyces crocatus]|uniref:Amidohydrolase n=1 Tax=Chondromyces crocatus TaxID=52 RepID=A0A0K1E679_CHOCO|nr:amidohydrolase family protein [Chondromyces crocatus]AKT36187.1 amidohydrolase [Chondromyces crocatus]